MTVPVPEPPAWANVAHVNTWLHTRFLPRSLPIVATIHHSVHHPDLRRYKGFARAAYHRFWIAPNERRVMCRAAKVCAVSKFVAQAAKETLADVSMDVVYNGIDTDRCRPREWRPPHNPFRLLYVGTWSRRKGVDLLLPIMRELGNDFELHYTGGFGAARDKQSMPGNMHDLGRLHGTEEVISAMQGADAFLFPSRSEGLPLSVLEAMACGLPVIASRGSSLVEIIDDGVTGILCSQDDVGKFIVACSRMRKEPSSLRSISKAARSDIVKRFSINRMADAYVQVYIRSIFKCELGQ